MITFIGIFALVILLGAGWLVANSAGQRKRSRQSGAAEVTNEQQGGGAPVTGRATGNN